VNWDDVGDAVLAAVLRASGLDDQHVVWKDQDRSAPTLDYIAVQLAGIIPLGIDHVQQTYDPSRPRGQEFELAVRRRQEVALEIECFTEGSVSGCRSAALALCNQVTMGLRLPSVAQLLRAQNVAVFDTGTPQWIPDVPSTKFRGRAVATVRTYMPPPLVAEYAGFIARVSGTTTARGGANGDIFQPFDSGDPDAT